MISSQYVRVWMAAKAAVWKLNHPVITSEHLFYACLRLHDQRHWELCRDLPLDVRSVWSHLQEQPAVVEESEDFCGLRLGVSARNALQKAEAATARRGYIMTGAGSLMVALLSESEGPVRSLLDACKATAGASTNEPPEN